MPAERITTVLLYGGDADLRAAAAAALAAAPVPSVPEPAREEPEEEEEAEERREGGEREVEMMRMMGIRNISFQGHVQGWFVGCERYSSNKG